jgi:hypothetical protein
MTPHGPRLLPLQNFAMDSSNHDDSTAGFRGFLPTILRGKWIITAFTALTLLLTMYFIFGVSVSKYRATAVVMLKTQRDNVIDLQGVVSGLSGERSSVNSEVEILRARGLMTEVVVKWSCFLGQVCVLAKMHLVSVHAAFSISALPKYAVSGVRFSRAV